MPKVDYRAVEAGLPLIYLQLKAEAESAKAADAEGRADIDLDAWSWYIPHRPTPKQHSFLALPNQEAFYGGAAGPGKSEGLLMAALQYVDRPNYAALILRRTFAELAKPGALMSRAREWLAPSTARWREQEKTWYFPGGGSLTFGYMEHENDKYQYQSAEFQFIGFDELTQFTRTQYQYMFSRLRRLKGSTIPLRVRSASNPDGPGFDWVKERFVSYPDPDRPFIAATIDDNPHLDREEYIETLQELDPITRARLLDGDWEATRGGKKFRRHWFETVDTYPADCKLVRYWDLAATEPRKGADPDWTAGALMGRTPDGILYLIDMRTERNTPQQIERLVKMTASADGLATAIWMEQEPGASGKSLISHYARNVVPGYEFRGDKVTGSKEVRANPLSSQAEAGNVKIVRGPWNSSFLDQAEGFPPEAGGHDDQIDAASGAFAKLTNEKKRIKMY